MDTAPGLFDTLGLPVDIANVDLVFARRDCVFTGHRRPVCGDGGGVDQQVLP